MLYPANVHNATVAIANDTRTITEIRSNELEIEIRDSVLRIRGCRRDTHYREGFIYQQMEITYSRFEKSIQFPGPIEGASIKHDYRDGFLIINLHRVDGA